MAGCALALACGLTAAPSRAGTATSTLDVSATVNDSCAIATTPLAFGVYEPLSTHLSSPLDAAGSVTVTCTPGTDAFVGLGMGNNGSGAPEDPTRQMAGGAQFLGYALYQDASRTVPWGDSPTFDDPSKVPHVGSGSPASIPVYGRIAPAQTVVPGNYQDTVVATVYF